MDDDTSHDAATGLPAATTAAQGDCENCGEPLQGDYCHRCGQSRHNPTRHLGHAIEEVFESVWHLDGRIFRTLRDLLLPGRVALDYLAGHRARYIAPFRLFVILSLLTFFVVNLTADIDPETAIQFDGQSDIARAESVAEVERLRNEKVAVMKRELRAVREQSPAATAAVTAAMAAVQSEAQNRIVELRSAPADAATADAGTAESGEDRRAWDAKANPISVPWLPDFANAWLNAQSERASRNVRRIRDDPAAFVHALIGAVPTALFFLVPVFALLLKFAYLFKRRLYLEHLVVALYSHAFLLLSLLLLSLSTALRGALPPGASALAVALGLLEGALWLWMPLYLLLMQRRVYAQGWPMTLLKYGVVGTLYFVLLGFGAAFLVTYVLVRM
jgi:hypothetical protein